MVVRVYLDRTVWNFREGGTCTDYICRVPAISVGLGLMSEVSSVLCSTLALHVDFFFISSALPYTDTIFVYCSSHEI